MITSQKILSKSPNQLNRIHLKQFIHSNNKNLDGWKSQPVNYDNFTKLINSLKNHGYDFWNLSILSRKWYLIYADIEQVPWQTSGEMFKGEFLWMLFDIVGIETRQGIKKQYRESAIGAQRPNIHACAVEFFTRHTDEKWDWTSNFSNMSDINFISNDLKICCRIHYYDKEALNNEKMN